jgi:integrase
MRQNELETLIPLRVRLHERRVIVLAKRKARQEYRERSVFLNTASIALLSERIVPGMDPQARIFNLKNGRKIWEWVRVQIGRPEVRWHDLRHTHATMLGRASKDPEDRPKTARSYPHRDFDELHLYRGRGDDR